jgi:glycosyltransferase involved in cell wall biosynthesis
MLAPEPPYPLNGGGAYRMASLVHYFARFAEVDLILFSESGKPALLPPGLVRSQQVIPLPVHGKGAGERYLRNARRAIRGVPPLIDRVSGFERQFRELVGARRYDLGIVEHFWCAPYIGEMSAVCERTVLDLHNLESVLNQRCAAAGAGLVAAGQRRFASLSRKLEAELLPRYSLVLAASRIDAERAAGIAPEAKLAVYPNALPDREIPLAPEEAAVVFSANFEYHPNIDAVAWLISEIWPRIRREHPELRLKLVGRGDAFIRHLIPGDANIDTTGAVDDTFPEIARARIVVAPLRAGSGTRIKILEAWAAGRAIVATPLAAEGLAVEDGTNIMLAADAAEFAGSVSKLLKDLNGRQRMGAAGRQTFERRYTWERAWGILNHDLRPHLQVTLSEEVNRYTE